MCVKTFEIVRPPFSYENPANFSSVFSIHPSAPHALHIYLGKGNLRPISKKSLLQIGVTHKELKSIEDRIIGLAPDDRKEEKRKKKKFYRYKKTARKGYDIDTRKLLFQKLI